MSLARQYWFPAKRFGWGWGFPVRLEGWAVLIVYFVLLGLVALHFPPGVHSVTFALLVALLTIALLVVCWMKGEPPRWRWGKD